VAQLNVHRSFSIVLELKPPGATTWLLVYDFHPKKCTSCARTFQRDASRNSSKFWANGTAGFYFLNSPLLKGVEPRRELAPVRVDNPSTLRGIGLRKFANFFTSRLAETLRPLRQITSKRVIIYPATAGSGQVVRTPIPYFWAKNACKAEESSEASSCQVSTLQRVRRSAERMQRMMACQRSIRSGRR
jgi:hypothetical protein